jgi:acyl-CoA dehydrogenase
VDERVYADPDHQLIADAVRRRCAAFDDDYWRACDDEHRFPWDFYQAMADDGWVGMAFPTEYGGGGRGILDAAVMMREIAASGGAMNACTPLHLTIFGLQPVVRFGSDELKAEFLPRAAAGDLHVAFGVTEPTAGTDTASITTRAVERDGRWYVSGQKIWTSKALEAEYVLLLARTEDGAATPGDRFAGLTLFLADLDRDHVDVRPIPKVGRNAVASCETFYDELPVEPHRVVGQVGQGVRHLLAGLNGERVLLAAEAIGIGEVSLERAVHYATERVVFGRPIGANQALSHPLADSYARLAAAWQMVLVAGERYDRGEPCGEQANLAKYLAADAGFQAADRAMQTLGGLGYASEYHVERYWREARLQRIAPVSQEMTLNFLAQNVLGLPRSY